MAGEDLYEHEAEEESFDVAFDDEKGVVSFEEEDDVENKKKINGIGEYGFGLWTRWSRTYPKYLNPKAVWHNLARFTVNRDHKDIEYKDRTLAIWVGVGYYHFTTYSQPHHVNLIKNMPYDD